ncbi:bublin coiled-coil protein [Ahaetulla prasina]|uniref:bublin coiled-coil protein n=1 Tax=Ahaetulla prasina TaxID=499056 RepID=UPI0026488394|nr:bublin coiled-coil protein [Ahaetulla prasina]
MSGPNGEPQLHLGRGGEEEEEEEEEGFGEAEYASINLMLDQINSCLDHLEEKNDHLNTQLKELLESNRQTRLEFQQQQQLGQDGEPRKAQPDS